MKEEIKEILDNLKKCCEIMKDESFVVYQKQDILKLLDCITNLEKRNKEIYDGFMATTKELCEYATRNEKAIEYIEKQNEFKEGCDINLITDWEYVINILKGDNNNER